MTKSYSGLERDNSKPRRGSFLNYFWTSSIHAVCFCNCYFNFNLRNPRKAYTVSAPQEEKQSKNLTSCGPAFGRFRSGKTTWNLGNSTNTGLYIRAGSRWSLPASLQGFACYIHYFKSQDMVRRWCLSSLNFGSIKI